MILSNDQLYEMSVRLLKELIAIPSFSREEDKTASVLEAFFQQQDVPTQRKGNNIWVRSKFFDSSRQTILLNSHHDTVRPNPAYTRDPFSPDVAEGKLYGLGSNDAGGPLVALIAAFLHFYNRHDLKFNLVFSASAEEEISGVNGIEGIWDELPKIDFAIVGEPTRNDMAVAEKGLMVLDCVSYGIAGHAAREEGINAIYQALNDIEWFRNYQFPRISPDLGKIKMSVTVIQAGHAHNQVPAECKFTVDVRVTDVYSLEEVLDAVQRNISSKVTARSLRLRPSGISREHPLVKSGKRLNMKLYGSPTTSDQAVIPVPSIKIGPGDSARSHTADEFIYLREIRDGIDCYIRLLEEIGNHKAES